MSVFDAVDTLLDGLIAADVQYSQRKGFPICVPGSFHQLILAFQITHRRYDFEQVGKRKKVRGKDQLSNYFNVL